MFRNDSFSCIETANGDVDYISMRIYYTGDWRAAVWAEKTTSVDWRFEQFRCSCGVIEALLGDHDPGHEGRSGGSSAHRAMTIGGGVIAIFERVTNRPAKTSSGQLLTHRFYLGDFVMVGIVKLSQFFTKQGVVGSICWHLQAGVLSRAQPNWVRLIEFFWVLEEWLPRK